VVASEAVGNAGGRMLASGMGGLSVGVTVACDHA
jgi:hypothetical protein